MRHIIETDRLELHLISAEELTTLFSDPENGAIYRNKNFSNPHRVLIDNPGPLPWRVPEVQADPSLNKWFVRWVVLKSNREIIGSTSFHGKPNDVGMIEIGLEIHPNFQRKGYGTEALLGMWRWVVTEDGVNTLRYTVGENNLASIALIRKLGFHEVGTQIDEIDGPELIFELSTEEFKSNYSPSSEA